MPTRFVPTLWTDAKQHIVRMAEAVNLALKGAHNEVHDWTLCTGISYSRFPQTGGTFAAAITSFTETPGGSGNFRAVTSTAHPLQVGDAAIIKSGGVGAFDTVNAIVTAINTGGNNFDFTWTTGTATTTGLVWRGYSNARITPDTVGVLVPANAAGAAMMGIHTFSAGTLPTQTPWNPGTLPTHTMPVGIYGVSHIGYIEFFHYAPSAPSNFKVILFGD